MNVFKFLATALAVSVAFPALADGGRIAITDAYALSASAAAKSGAAFMVISNAADQDDRLVEARSDAAERVELHTHLMDSNGVARMVEVEEGFAIPAGGNHTLRRGADHVMFMGLTQPFEVGKTVRVTLVFEQAGEVEVEIPVVQPQPQGPAAGAGNGAMMQGHKHGG